MAQELTLMDRAEKKLAQCVLAASATGAIPVPATSVALIAENTVMISDIASIFEIQIDLHIVMESFSIVGVLNLIGREVFVEGAKLLAWGTGSVWAAAGLVALGATTAGVQTYMIGRLVIAICKNNGEPLNKKQASEIFKDAQTSYNSFSEKWKGKDFYTSRGGSSYEGDACADECKTVARLDY